MQVLTVAQVLALPEGSPVPCVKVQIKEVKDFYSGVKDGKEWAVQNVNVMDATGKIKVKLQRRPELTKDWTNRWVYIEAGQGAKGKYVGATRGSEEYRGRVSELIELRDSAIITDASQWQGDKEQPQQTQQKQEAPPPQTREAQAGRNVQAPPGNPAPQERPPQKTTQTQHKAPVPGSDEDKKDAVEKMRVFLAKHATGMILAIDAAVYVTNVTKEKHGIQWTSEDIRAIAISLGISADRAYHFDGLPNKL
jgi:hypothetical protein